MGTRATVNSQGRQPEMTGVLVAGCLAILLGALASSAGAAPAAATTAVATPAYGACSVITWRYDATGEPESGAGMIRDVHGALARVANRTGVTFQATPAGVVADIVIGWSPLDDYEPGTQAAGWRSGVMFALDGVMTRDEWSGFGRRAVRQPDGSFDVGIGRGWLVVHEVMHSLGLGHSDEPGSVMAPTATITNVVGRSNRAKELRELPRPGFSPGDLVTLAEMYPRSGCESVAHSVVEAP